MPRTTILVGLILLLGVTISSAQEEITFTTYYPSPHGVYKKLRLYPDATFGASDCDELGEEGLMYYDAGLAQCRVCVELIE